MGAGFHGGFGSTKGAHVNIPVEKQKDVKYNRKKLQEYLLNENHPQGGSKAKFFREVLGYTPKDVRLFFNNVVEAIKGKSPLSSVTTPYGVKYTYQAELRGKNAEQEKVTVLVVIQKDQGADRVRIITVYPYRKEQ